MQSAKLVAGAINHLRECRYGYMLYNIHDAYIGKSFELYGEFSEGEVELFRQVVQPGDVVIDAGANIGAHTVFFAKTVGPSGAVLAFEPQRVVFQTLCANIALNSLLNVICYNLALGDKRGTITVPSLNYAAPENFGGLSLRQDPRVVGESVDVVELDSLQLPRCRFIKIDVEGMEQFVLRGARNTIARLTPILYVENDREEGAEGLAAFIDSLGYEMYAHTPYLFNPANHFGNTTNVFPGTVSVNLLCIHPSLGIKLEGFERVRPGEGRKFATVDAVGRAKSMGPQLLEDAVRLHQAGNLAEAERTYNQVLQVDPYNAPAWHLLGALAHQAGDNERALERIGQALRLRPDFPEAHFNRGVVLRMLGRSDEALQSLAEALRWKPDYADAHVNRGDILRELGRLDEAQAHLRQALLLRPDFVEAHINLAIVYLGLGRLDEAFSSASEAVRLRPGAAEGHNVLGIILLQQKKLDEARARLEEAIRLNPNLAEAHNNLGNVLKEMGKWEDAAECYRGALRRKPGLVDVHNNLGNALRELGHYEEALPCYERALSLQPNYSKAYNNLGNALREQERLPEAATYYRQSLSLTPFDADAHTNLGMCLLSQGDFEHGWAEYEWRLQSPDSLLGTFPQPLWQGEPLHGRTIYLHAEQGLGDTIQFIRYAPLLQARGGRVLLACPQALLRLFASCWGIDQLIPYGEAVPAFDLHAPLLSLPRLLGTNSVERIPADVPYLSVDDELVRFWREPIASVPGFRVGICWQGNPSNRGDRKRSVPVTRFAALAEVPGMNLVSLQVGFGSEQLRETPHIAFEPHVERTDLADTAALMKNLDLVVTVDTALGHLAGALGLPVWMALGHAPDWRWLPGRADSPWYPSMRLFRQARPGDWDSVFTAIKRALEDRD